MSRPGEAFAFPAAAAETRRHSDNLNNLVIASVSLGAERTFIMSPRVPSKAGGNKLDPAVEADLHGRKNVKWM